jgi:hypothetical protein
MVTSKFARRRSDVLKLLPDSCRRVHRALDVPTEMREFFIKRGIQPAATPTPTPKSPSSTPILPR